MKNLIYFNNSNKEKILSNNLISNNLNLEKKNITLTDKISLFNYNINKIKDILHISIDSIYISTINYIKIISEIIISICKSYINNNNLLPHIIINENNELISLCKKLNKCKLIELSIVDNYNLLDNIKKTKKINSIICIINLYNINIINDLKKISSYCKYYNIFFISNIYDDISVYQNINLINELYNQDLIIYHLLNYKILNNKDTDKYKILNIYYIFIKKKIINKFKLIDIINNNKIHDKNFNNFYLLNSNDIITSINIKNQNYNKINSLYQYIINNLKNKYKIISYLNLINNNNKLYYNSPTLIFFTIPNNITYIINHIYFSLYLPNILFTNDILIDYFKSNKIILSKINYVPFKIDKYINDIKKGLIYIKFNENTTLEDIDKFLYILEKFIDKLFNVNLKKKNKKKVSFKNPEFVICKKIINSTMSKINNNIKGILKKK
jgi:hypothetical protein